RQRVQEHEPSGHHVAGQPLAQPRPQFTGRPAVAAGHDVRGEVGLVVGAAMRPHHGFEDGRVRLEGGFDLSEFDAVAADLDLGVGAAEVLQPASGGPAGEVAGAVQTAAGPVAEVVGDEAFGGQRGPPDISSCDSGSGDVDLAGDAYRAGPAVRVEHVDAQVGQGTADPAGCPAEVVFCEFEVGDVDGG